MNYLLTGLESYRINERKKQIITETVGKATELSVSTYRDVEESSLDLVLEDCAAISFFAEKKVVIYENPSFFKLKKSGKKTSSTNLGSDEQALDRGLNQLMDYLKNPNELTTLVIIVDKDLGKNAIVTQLSKVMLYQNFAKVNQTEFQQIVRSDLNQNQLRLDQGALNELFLRLPLDIENWKRELDKLVLYPGKLTTKVIKELVCKPLEDDVFALSNAVMNKNLSQAINIYHDLLVNDKYVSIPLIGLLASQLRFNCQCKILLEHQYTLNEIASELNAHSYRVQKTLENTQYATSKDYLKLLSDLAKLDQSVKTGKIDAVVGLELFIMKSIRG